MELREATSDDVDGIRTVARASLDASYGHAISGDIIDQAIEQWYAADQLSDDLDDEGTVFVVAVEDDEIVGFGQSYITKRRETVGEITWLHVDPNHRGHGLGSDLLEEVERRLIRKGAERIEGRVLVENEAGAQFYEDHGFKSTGQRTIAIGDEEFVEQFFTEFADEEVGEQIVTERRVGPSGQVLYVAYDERERGSQAPFFPAYSDRERGERFGYFCGNCESFATTMDAMGRIECNECGNRRKPSRWDSAYL